jgi:8-oxo-dGTP pyrophosphatase MutT (NUDIX family)
VYRHPYGFVVCRLEEEYFRNYQIRAHLWPSADEFADAQLRAGTAHYQVHSHGWRLESQVLLGAVVESGYSVKPDVDGHERLFAVENDYAVGVSRLVEQDMPVHVEVEAVTTRTDASGALVIGAGEYHATRPEVGPSVTVAATETRGRGAVSYVVGPPIQGRIIVNARLEVRELDGVLREYDQLYGEVTARADRWASFIFVTDGNNNVLMVRSVRRPDLWQPIGGRGAAWDADPLATGIREAAEEAGLVIRGDELAQLETTDRDVGQGAVHFWALRLPARPDVRIARTELAEATWIPLAELRSLAVYPATRGALKTLERLLTGPESDRGIPY